MPMLSTHDKQMRATESSVTHDTALRAGQEDLGWRERVAHTTGAFCHDRDFSVATDLSNNQKKKDP